MLQQHKTPNPPGARQSSMLYFIHWEEVDTVSFLHGKTAQDGSLTRSAASDSGQPFPHRVEEWKRRLKKMGGRAIHDGFHPALRGMEG